MAAKPRRSDRPADKLAESAHLASLDVTRRSSGSLGGRFAGWEVLVARTNPASVARTVSVFAIASLVATAAAAEPPADDRPDEERPDIGGEILVIGPATPIAIDRSLADLPPAPSWKVGDPLPDMNPRRVTNPDALTRPAPVFTPRPDPLVALQLRAARRSDRTFTTPDVNVAGLDNSCCPPDTVGEVGTTHFVQMVNPSGGPGSQVVVHDKATGTAVMGYPISLSSLAPIGDPCAGGDGDPIPIFDQLADRWLLTEFQLNGATKHLCVYVSSGADPTTSTWMLYRFDTGSTLYDYPKYGVWPDAYYGAANQISRPLFALDRTAMLAGTPATMIIRTHDTLAGFAFQITPPADLGGAAPPPAGSPGIFIRHRDDEAHDGGGANPANDRLQIFEFTADFANPANSDLSDPIDIAISEFESDLCGLTSFACFPQPDPTRTLDPLREVIMNRPVYRNFGTHQSLVGSFVTDVDGGSGDRGGVRWFELRRAAGATSGGWSLHQEGTVSAADGLSR